MGRVRARARSDKAQVQAQSGHSRRTNDQGGGANLQTTESQGPKPEGATQEDGRKPNPLAQERWKRVRACSQDIAAKSAPAAPQRGLLIALQNEGLRDWIFRRSSSFGSVPHSIETSQDSDSAATNQFGSGAIDMRAEISQLAQMTKSLQQLVQQQADTVHNTATNVQKLWRVMVKLHPRTAGSMDAIETDSPFKARSQPGSEAGYSVPESEAGNSSRKVRRVRRSASKSDCSSSRLASPSPNASRGSGNAGCGDATSNGEAYGELQLCTGADLQRCLMSSQSKPTGPHSDSGSSMKV